MKKNIKSIVHLQPGFYFFTIFYIIFIIFEGYCIVQSENSPKQAVKRKAVIFVNNINLLHEESPDPFDCQQDRSLTKCKYCNCHWRSAAHLYRSSVLKDMQFLEHCMLSMVLLRGGYKIENSFAKKSTYPK